MDSKTQGIDYDAGYEDGYNAALIDLSIKFKNHISVMVENIVEEIHSLDFKGAIV